MDIQSLKIINNDDGTYTPTSYINNTSIMIITPEHDKIHNGRGFECSGKASITSGASFLILIQTANCLTHLRLIHMDLTGAPADIYLYESPTISNNGTLISLINKNRNSSLVPCTLIYHTPTVSVNGTQLSYHLINGAKQSGGSNDNFEDEWVLNRNTKYLLLITNNSVSTETLGFKFFWYEA